MAMFPAGPMKTGLVALTAITVVAVLVACGGGQEDKRSADGRAQALAVTSPNTPTAYWAPASITMSANPGGRQDIPITLTAAIAMSNVTLTIPTALKSVFSIAPTSLGTFKAGEAKTVIATVAPSATESIRTLSGAVTLRAGFAAIAQSLPISVSLVAPESINGVIVPPEPPKELNDLSIAGFDMNANGVRDDIERAMAVSFGRSSTRFAEAISFAKAEQAAIVFDTSAARDAYTRAIDCTPLTASELDPFTYALLNTPARGNAYSKANAGASSGGYCR